MTAVTIDRDDVSIEDTRGNIDVRYRPTGYGLLIMPITPPEKTKGGIYVPQTVNDVNEARTNVGRIVRIGPAAYKAERFNDWEIPNLGDYVTFGQYAGKIIELLVPSLGRFVKFRYIFDDEVTGIIENPEDIKLYIA